MTATHADCRAGVSLFSAFLLLRRRLPQWSHPKRIHLMWARCADDAKLVSLTLPASVARRRESASLAFDQSRCSGKLFPNTRHAYQSGWNRNEIALYFIALRSSRRLPLLRPFGASVETRAVDIAQNEEEPTPRVREREQMRGKWDKNKWLADVTVEALKTVIHSIISGNFDTVFINKITSHSAYRLFGSMSRRVIVCFSWGSFDNKTMT